MLSNALAIGEGDTTLIAPWDGREAKGPAGPSTWSSRSGSAARAIVLDTRQLFRAVIVSVLRAAPTCYDLSLLPASLLTQAF
jgi:hypothetical protein